MKIALIAGTIVALFNIGLSLISGDWNIAFILSGTVSLITLVISSLLRNASIAFNRRAKAIKEEAEAFTESLRIASLISIFSLPNIIVTIVLFLKIYGLNFIIERIK